MKKRLVFMATLLLIVGVSLFFLIENKKDTENDTNIVSNSINNSDGSSITNSSENKYSNEIVKEEDSIKNGSENIYGYFTAPKNYKKLNLPAIIFLMDLVVMQNLEMLMHNIFPVKDI